MPEKERTKEECEVRATAALQAEVVTVTSEHLWMFAAEVLTPYSLPSPSQSSFALPQPVILRRCVLSARNLTAPEKERLRKDVRGEQKRQCRHKWWRV